MHQGKSLTFIAQRCSSRRDDTHDAPTAVVRVLIYLRQKLNICLLLICGCLRRHMMYVVDLMPRGLQSYGDKFLTIKSEETDGNDDDDDDEKLNFKQL